jgi:hypothetical protein
MKPVRAHWPAILAVALIVVLGLGALFLTGRARAIAIVLWGVVPISVAVAQYAYTRFEPFRLLANRVWFQATNPASTWGLVAEFEVADAAKAWAAAERSVDASLGPGDKVMLRTEGDAVWTSRGMTLQVKATETGDPVLGDTPLIRLEMPPTTRPFRAWKRSIEDVAAPLVNGVEQAIGPEGRKFVVRVAFAGDNPYFGLFVSQVQRSAVARFDVEFFEQAAAERDVVRVRKDDVEVVTGTLLSAVRLSLRYLALAQPQS